MIPDSWTTRRFADIAAYKSGRTPARANNAYWHDSDVSVPWVAISDMTDFGVVTKTKETVTRKAFDEVFQGQVVPAGTLLMSFKLTVGRVATLGIDACHNEAIISIYPVPEINQRYLKYFLGQVDYGSLQDRQVKGNTLNRQKLDRIQISVPSPAEQSSIADVLDLVKRSMDLQDHALSEALALKRAAMRTLFTRGLGGESQKETEIGPVPKSWAPRMILDLCDIRSGGTPRKSVAEYWDGGIPWVSGKDLKQPTLDDTIDHVSPEGVATGSRMAPAGSVLLLVRGMGLAKDLPVAVINRPMAFNQDVKALVSQGEFSGSFLRSAIYVCKEQLLSRIVSSAHGTMTLNLNDVENFQIPCPSNPAEADEIVAILDAIDRKIDLHRKKRAVLDDLFKVLLHKLMTGEIRISELDLSGSFQ